MRCAGHGVIPPLLVFYWYRSVSLSGRWKRLPLFSPHEKPLLASCLLRGKKNGGNQARKRMNAWSSVCGKGRSRRRRSVPVVLPKLAQLGKAEAAWAASVSVERECHAAARRCYFAPFLEAGAFVVGAGALAASASSDPVVKLTRLPAGM